MSKTTDKRIIFLLLFINTLMFLLNRTGVFAADKQVQSATLSLKDISELALHNNIDIQIARYDAYIQRTKNMDTQSIFDTVLNAQAGYSDDQSKTASTFSGTKTVINRYDFGLSKKLSTGTTLGLDIADTRTFNNASSTTLSPAHEAVTKFSLHQPLGSNFFGMADRAQVKITKLDVANSDYQALNRIEQSLGRTQTVYWQLVLAYNELKIAREMLGKAQQLYDIFKNKNEAGLIEEAELYAAEANVLNRQNTVETLSHNLLLVKNDLLFLIHEEDLSLQIIPQDIFTDNDMQVDTISSLKQAIKTNRDYLQAKNNVQAKGINLSMKQNAMWPEIDLELSYAQNGLELDQDKAWENVSAEDNPEIFMGIAVNMPLENNSAKSRKEKADLEKRSALLVLKKTEHKLLVDITNSVDAVNNRREKIRLNKNIVELQQNKLNFEEKRFASGRSDSDTLIRYQEDLLNSKLNLTQSLYDYEKVKIGLKLIENTLFDQSRDEKL
ncbi:MAG: TolC family protein [Candidatus Omnitrophota bacterium]